MIKERKIIFEQALNFVPSYKIWYNYLQETLEYVSGKSIFNQIYKETGVLFERCLKLLQKVSENSLTLQDAYNLVALLRLFAEPEPNNPDKEGIRPRLREFARDPAQ